MIMCGQFVMRLTKKMQLLTDEVLDGLSTPIYCRSLDAITLREPTVPNGRLIAEDPAPSVPRVGMPRPPRSTLQDLSKRMGHMEIQQGVLERMSRRLDEAYAPPRYDEQQQQE
ncbi:hypothetical protein Tco_0836385 [Tanacetum coccineum]